MRPVTIVAVGALAWTTVAGLLCGVARPAFGEEEIMVPCEEHKLLTGDDLCHVFPALRWNKAEWEATKASRERTDCRDAVWQKYADLGKYGVRRATEGSWFQDVRPDEVSEEDWISCTPPNVWSSGVGSYSCYDELESCTSERPPPSPPPKLMTVYE